MPIIVLSSAIFYSFALLLIAGESKEASIFPPVICLITIIIFIKRMRLKQFIEDESLWYYFASLKIVVSVLTYYIFWYAPLDQISFLRMDSQEYDGYQDALFYDYLGSKVARLPLSEWPQYINATWLSQGIVSYLGTIYSLFGVSQTNYLFINLAISFTSLYFLTCIIGSDLNGKINYAAFMPFVLYYEMTPGKECLTNSLTFSTIYFGVKILNGKGSVRNIIFMFLSIVGLGLVRLNALALVILYLIILLAFAKHFKVLLMILIGFITVFLIGTSNEVLNAIVSLQSYSDALASRGQLLETSSVKFFFFTLLTSDNLFVNALLSPFRLIVWILSPLPANVFLVIWDVFESSGYLRFRTAEFATRILSSIILLFILLEFAFSKRLRQQLFRLNEKQKTIFVAIIVFGILLSTTNFIEGARYRTLIEPLVMTFFLMSKFRSKNA